MARNPSLARGNARGVSLIEILVTILVTTLGLLGFAALLSKSIVENRQAMARTQATLLASDIIERMRANRPAALAGSYSIALNTVPFGNALADQDLAQWKANLTNQLPAGDGMVAVDASGNSTVTIEWDDDGDGVPTRFVTQTAL